MKHKKRLNKLLEEYKTGRLTIEEAVEALSGCPGADPNLGDALLDVNREDRAGFPEAIYGAGKTPEQVVRIFQTFLENSGKALATRCSPETLEALQRAFPGILINHQARAAWVKVGRREKGPPGVASILCAGTSDLPVAEEAAVTLEFAGVQVHRHADIGVAGIHRLLGRVKEIRQADVVIAVAGMEGALPSVIGGLVSVPVIAVPTSVGYGAAFQGLTALLAMLNSCSAGITVVNIDNGFGAAVAAVRVLKGRG